MRCHLGDFAQYAGLRRELGDLEKKNAAIGATTAAPSATGASGGSPSCAGR